MDDIRRAIHETGHLILALDYGWDVVGIGIDNGSGNKGGLIVFHPDPSEIIENCLSGADDIYQYDRLLLQLAAGGAAEELMFPGHEEGCYGGEASDSGQFSKYLDNWKTAGLDTQDLELNLFSEAMKKAKTLLSSS
ncbi:hypothetical protein Q0M94_15545 [Deinococcus radiomollis]|uniref:hypothetical protein n=1 Tax=Deinococcus radiomollis TaxID=468916 RepID=UPI00389196B9